MARPLHRHHIDRGVDALLAEAIGAENGRPALATPAEMAEVLHAAASGWKHRVRTRAEFTEKVGLAVRLVLGPATDGEY